MVQVVQFGIPLSGHDFCVRARNGKSGIDASLGVLFDNFTSDDTTSSNAAVVRALRSGLSATGREAEGEPSGRIIVYSCSRSKEHLVVFELLFDTSTGGASD